MTSLNDLFKNIEEKLAVTIEEMVKNPPPEATSLESADQVKQQTKDMLMDILAAKDIRLRMDEGFEAIFQELSSREAPIVIQGIKNEWLEYTKNMLNLMERDTPPASEEEAMQAFKEGFALSEDTMDRFYQCGVRLYQDKNYQKAADAFFVVSSIDYRRHGVWLGLGLAEQELGHHQFALSAFSMAALTNMQDPMSFVYSAECYIALKEYKDAEECIQTALELIHGKTDDESQRIGEYLAILKKKL